jgi:ubiquinone/menaquinone biosynthesis C-methylase UbiE
MQDAERVFRDLALKRGDSFLDLVLGCGLGNYAIHAAKVVGATGIVYALDRREELLDRLRARADSEGLRNVKVMAADVTAPLPLEAERVDVCFMATVLHVPDVRRSMPALFGEIRRIPRQGGRVAIIECKKESRPFGPPDHMRLSPEDIEPLLQDQGFEKTGMSDLGHNYMVQFVARCG